MRLAHTIDEAAEVLSLSPTKFREWVLPEIAVVRRGGRVIVPTSELQKWLDSRAEVL